MLLDVLGRVPLEILVNIPPVLRIALLFVMIWAIWWLWRFTISPALHPNEPKELPYVVPVLGHGVAFFNDSNALLSRARNYFGNTKEPYALTIAGMKTYIITKGQDVSEAYRNTQELSFAEFSRALMRILGASDFCVEAAHAPLPRDKPGYPNPKGLPLITLSRQMHARQLAPGANLDHLENHFLSFFTTHLTMSSLLSNPPAHSQITPSPTPTITLPLMSWVSTLLTTASQTSYFGPSLSTLFPSLIPSFLTFDTLSHQALYQYPSFLATDMHAALDDMQASLKAYIQIPSADRGAESAGWFVREVESEMRAVGIGEDDIARMLVSIYWAVNSNFRKAAFWMVGYMLREGLMGVVRGEVEGAFRFVKGEDGKMEETVDLEYLHNKCPRLDAVWDETVRLAAYSASVRFITGDTTIGGKVLRKGNRLMIAYRQLHFDEAVFGGEVDKFRAERFLDNKGLSRNNASWRPWGGGTTMCPGRHLAKRATVLFVAMLVRRFDVEMVEGQRFPEAEEGKPVVGLMDVKMGQDLMVRLRPRSGNV